MAESLYLQLPRADQPVRWLLVDTLGNHIGYVQQGTLADAAAQSAGRKVIAILPAEDVSLLHVEVPSRNPQKVLQAVPFILEDKLAEDVETLHFALGERGATGQLVAVISRAGLRRRLDELATAGIAPTRVVPDVCAVLPEVDAAVVVLADGMSLVRLPDGSGFGADASLTAHLLKRRIADFTPALSRVDIHGTPEEMDALDAALAGTQLERVRRPMEGGMLPLLARHLAAQRGLDLLQGEFKLQNSLQEQWRQWRLATYLAVICLVLGITQQVISYVKLRHQAAALDAQVAQIYTQATGAPVPTSTDAMSAMKSRLLALQGGSSAGSLLALLDALGTGLNGNTAIQVTGINYQGSTLQAQLQAGDIASLDSLKSALNKQTGITANLDSVNASGSRVTARLVLSGGSS
ncbi:MAG TPA: type II secretion system protein GspL [Gammaproteobacteria bacterium]|nr:type II secretion system protein GspL [Gammaproteobacteria bacterium]